MNDTKKILEKLSNLSIKTRKKDFFFLSMALLMIFLALNIIFSQNISPIYYGLTINDRTSTVEYLKRIKKNPEFSKQLKYFESIYGDSIKDDVYAEDRRREAKIKEFEQILQKSPYSRDALYSLYRLYNEKGDLLTAEKYLMMAKAVDPNIK